MSELRNSASRPERFVIERFCRRHDIADAVVLLIDMGPVGSEYVVVAFEKRTAYKTDRVLLGKLGRQLAPLLERHIVAYRPVVDAASLTRREQEIVDLVARGLSNVEIADILHVAIDTVKKHLTHIFAKTGCSSRTQLALSWRK